jgi:uncharacterized protein with GYD domain
MLSHLTAEGKKTVKENWEPDRIREQNREVETLGAKVIAQYALLGPYDFITLLEAPDLETVARVSVELGRRGTVQYETFPAIPVETFMASLKAPRQAEFAVPR